MISIRSASLKDQPAWDHYLDKHPDAPPYCRFAWRRAVEQAYGHKAHYLIAEDEEKVCGILPLFVFHIPFLGNTLVSLPYCDAGGVYGDSEEVCRRLIDVAYSSVEKGKVRKLEIRSIKNIESLEESSNKWNVSINTGKVRMLLQLPSNSEELWTSFKSKLRSQVRKAEKNGLIFQWGGLQNLDDIYKVFAVNMHQLGSPVHSKKWLREIILQYGDRAMTGMVLLGNHVVGMGIILLGPQTVSIPWASTLREFNRLGPNMLLYWNFLKFSADNNFQYFDFGRSTKGEGTYRFKKQWGAEPIPLKWYSYSAGSTNPQEHHFHASSTSNLRARVAALWARMPLSVANFIGPHLRKYIKL